MQVEPDARTARQDERAVLRLVRAGLSRTLPRAVLPPDREIAYPGYHATAHRAQRLARDGAPSPGQLDRLYAELRAVDARARASAARSARSAEGGRWPVDLPPAEGHLTESLDRARACIPKRSDRSADVAALTVAPWGPQHHHAFDEAVGVLGRAWPQMLAEVSTVVRQVALLEGWGIDGFTDFTVHGVVFVNSARVVPDSGAAALPAPFPLVEALVHEGTHNRCDAAAVTAPFLADTPAQLLRTPLRSDPRPLTGLFQQIVVLARSVLLYERLLAAPEDTVDGARAQAEARRDLLVAQGRDGLATLDGQCDALTDHGRSVAAQARRVLERAAR